MSAQPLVAVLLFGIAFVGAMAFGFVLVVVAATAASRRRARHAPPAAPPVSADELAQRAGALLLEMDAALETAGQDVGFAEAEFGEEAARPYREALERARADTAEAFRLQRAGDATVLAEIVRHLEYARAELGAQSARFEELRAQAKRAPEVALAVEQAVEACGERAAVAEATLARLRAMYAPRVLAPIEHAPALACERLRCANARVDEAHEAIREGDANKAAGILREAQEAAAQAGRLLDAVDESAAKLEAERLRLTAGLAEIRPADGRF